MVLDTVNVLIVEQLGKKNLTSLCYSIATSLLTLKDL